MAALIISFPLRECCPVLTPPVLTTWRFPDFLRRDESGILIDARAATNPHAGEDGTIGREEVDILRPAVARLQAEGMDMTGPFPADSLFHDDARRTYDAVLCMYHDQGHVPLKLLDFEGGVNVALGLPIIRTSVDHGTAFDIAGKGMADAESMISAVLLAARLATSG